VSWSHSHENGKPDFPELCECVLQRHSSIPLTYMAFDVLSVEGEPVVSRPYRERRRLLAELRLDGRQWRTPEAFDDGEALWEAVCEHELEGVVAKPRSGQYVSGGRGWINTKNRDYWRYEMEREGARTIKASRTVPTDTSCYRSTQSGHAAMRRHLLTFTASRFHFSGGTENEGQSNSRRRPRGARVPCRFAALGDAGSGPPWQLPVSKKQAEAAFKSFTWSGEHVKNVRCKGIWADRASFEKGVYHGNPGWDCFGTAAKGRCDGGLAIGDNQISWHR